MASGTGKPSVLVDLTRGGGERAAVEQEMIRVSRGVLQGLDEEKPFVCFVVGKHGVAVASNFDTKEKLLTFVRSWVQMMGAAKSTGFDEMLRVEMPSGPAGKPS